MREHNRLAGEISTANPGMSDDDVYQRARKLVVPKFRSSHTRSFCRRCWVRTLRVSRASTTVISMRPSSRNSPQHSIVSATRCCRRNCSVSKTTEHRRPAGPWDCSMRSFVPQNLGASSNELDYFLKGLASDQQQEVDMHMVDDVRDFLFGEPIPGGFRPGELEHPTRPRSRPARLQRDSRSVRIGAEGVIRRYFVGPHHPSGPAIALRRASTISTPGSARFPKTLR